MCCGKISYQTFFINDLKVPCLLYTSKTGFFLDQKYNRLAIQKLCRGARVLDCFTHTGSFALNAGVAGAKSVLGVDASGLAVAQARENAALNGLSDRVEFREADVFELLPSLVENGEKYDVCL